MDTEKRWKSTTQSASSVVFNFSSSFSSFAFGGFGKLQKLCKSENGRKIIRNVIATEYKRKLLLAKKRVKSPGPRQNYALLPMCQAISDAMSPAEINYKLHQITATTTGCRSDNDYHISFPANELRKLKDETCWLSQAFRCIRLNSRERSKKKTTVCRVV